MKFSYDYYGINDKSKEYSPRVATFEKEALTDPELNDIGYLFQAAPEMLAMLESIAEVGVHDSAGLLALIKRAKHGA